MSEFLKPRQAEMEREIMPLCEDDGMAVITIEDYAHLRIDGVLSRDKSMDSSDGILEPSEKYVASRFNGAVKLGLDLVGDDLHLLYEESKIAAGNNPDFRNLSTSQNAFERYVNDGSIGSKSSSLVMVDSGLNLLGFGIVTPNCDIATVVQRKFRANIIGEQVTEGTLLRGFVKRFSRGLGDLLASGMLSHVDAMGLADEAILAKSDRSDNGVAEAILRLTHPTVALAEHHSVAGFQESYQVVPPAQREVLRLAS